MSTIAIKLRGGVSVSVEVVKQFGCLAVHPKPGGPAGFNVAHVPTGVAIVKGQSLRKALVIAEGLSGVADTLPDDVDQFQEWQYTLDYSAFQERLTRLIFDINREIGK